MKDVINSNLETIQSHYNYKHSLRGIKNRPKHEENLKKTEEYGEIAKKYLSYRALIDINP